MRLPIDPNRATLLIIGDPIAKLEFGRLEQKLNKDGVLLWTVAVLMSGTGERQDPTANITVASPERPKVAKGDAVVARNLFARTWTMRDNQGRERSGVAFEAEALDVVKSK